MKDQSKVDAKNRSTSAPWHSSRWVHFSLFLYAAAIVFLTLICDLGIAYGAGQLLLLLSLYGSIKIIGGQKLLNPLLICTGAFFWWFSIGPNVIAALNYLRGDTEQVASVVRYATIPLYITAPGLLLYALSANFVSKAMKAGGMFITTFSSEENYLHYSFILTLVGIGAACTAFLSLSGLGEIGVETTNYLGGTRTTIWWVGVMIAVCKVSEFGYSAMAYFITNSKKAHLFQILLSLIIILSATAWGFFSGTKQQMVRLLFFVLVGYIIKKQKIPWLFFAGILVLYLGIVEPVISMARTRSEVSRISTTSERKALFMDLLKTGEVEKTVTDNERDLAFESPFRGIYRVCGMICIKSRTFEGGYNANNTVLLGLRALIPRVLYRDKPDMDIGNYFARTVGAELGISSENNYITCISVPFPFELVANFGLFSAFFGFIAIGVIWSFICNLILSPYHLSDHPFVPFFCYLNITQVEAPLGHWLAGLRDVLIPILVLYLFIRFFNWMQIFFPSRFALRFDRAKSSRAVSTSPERGAYQSSQE